MFEERGGKGWKRMEKGGRAGERYGRTGYKKQRGFVARFFMLLIAATVLSAHKNKHPF